MLQQRLFVLFATLLHLAAGFFAVFLSFIECFAYFVDVFVNFVGLVFRIG